MLKQAKFSSENVDYTMNYDCPDQEIESQINEIFSDKDYELAKRKRNMVVLDVGANIGMFSLFIKDWAKKIYAIEPSKRCFEALRENTKDWNNIEIFNIGFANKKGEGFLYGKEEETPQTMVLEGENRETIDITTIEDFLNENKIEHIDVMKIDVEGMEYVILTDETFRRIASKIDFIIGESHYIQQAIPEHALLMLKKAGFKAKLLPRENYVLWLNYENKVTGQKEKYEVKKPTLFIGEK